MQLITMKLLGPFFEIFFFDCCCIFIIPIWSLNILFCWYPPLWIYLLSFCSYIVSQVYCMNLLLGFFNLLIIIMEFLSFFEQANSLGYNLILLVLLLFIIVLIPHCCSHFICTRLGLFYLLGCCLIFSSLQWFNQLQTGRALTVRDLLSWVAFINVTEKSLQPDYAFLHGAFLVLLDGLSLGTSLPCVSCILSSVFRQYSCCLIC